MRIGQFTDSFYPIVDGVGRVVLSYANILPKLGDQCYVIAPMTDTGYRGGYPFDLVDYWGAPVPGSPQYKAGLAVFDRHYGERIERVKLDIAHAHTPFFSGQEALRLCVKHDTPLVGTFHSKYYDDFYKATHAELLANIGVKYVVDFYERCDEVWAVSESSANVLKEYGYRGDVVVMENGTDMRLPRPEDKQAAAERFGLDLSAPVLLYVGQINWKKNILRILEAAAELNQRGERFSVVLTGQGPDESAIHKKAAELGLENHVIFTGHVNDTALLDGLYQCAALFVFPSLYDTFSLVMREAAAMETPSVLTRGSAAAEAVTDGVNGLLCEDSGHSLADVIARTMNDPQALRRLGKAARETIPIDWNDVLGKVRERYSNLIECSNSEDMRKRHAMLKAHLLERFKQQKELQKLE